MHVEVRVNQRRLWVAEVGIWGGVGGSLWWPFWWFMASCGGGGSCLFVRGGVGGGCFEGVTRQMVHVTSSAT